MTTWVLTLSCPDRPGIVAAVAGALAGLEGNITESQQFGDPETGLFFMRVQVACEADRELIAEAIGAVGQQFAMTWNLDEVGRRMRTVLMVSTAAHCLHDLAYRQRSGQLPVEITAVVSNHETLRPIADFYGLPFHHVPVVGGSAESKESAEAELRRIVESTGTELVVLARYMQILSDELCRDLAGRIINIHHSFLPSFKGARPYAQAHARGVKLIGATAHYATADLDEGPIIEQDVARVEHDDPVAQLQAMGEDVERRVLARAVGWHAEHRILLDGRRTVVFH
ncbi:formyltetrahydrofolate deformylase [Serinibacter salmoneus]|uniref:Formyltetrahydrofolate deformylase n=1 Tax=Serinibacter salmoneus TaxID=556530 RepID=A0A2A9CZD1_9MICO|nr:formyltetrahydrofolate deformylase [Serinibacter salmoneus]PFG19042.1 formyltetrahydrofolate deformylase [Serinibacter salmoneus]